MGEAFADPSLESARQALLLSGFSILDAKDYDRILALEAEVDAAGGVALL